MIDMLYPLIQGLGSGGIHYIRETAGVNAFTATHEDIDEYSEGLAVSVTFSSANTGASTLNINGMGAIQILENGHQQLQANEILHLSTHLLVYNAQFQYFAIVSQRGRLNANQRLMEGDVVVWGDHTTNGHAHANHHISHGSATVNGHLVSNGSTNLNGTTIVNVAPTGHHSINNPGQSGQFEISNAGAGAAGISFHRAGVFGTHLGLATDNRLKYGGWSLGQNEYDVWHNGMDLAGYVDGPNIPIIPWDTPMSALGKLQGQINTKVRIVAQGHAGFDAVGNAEVHHPSVNPDRSTVIIAFHGGFTAYFREALSNQLIAVNSVPIVHSRTSNLFRAVAGNIFDGDPTMNQLQSFFWHLVSWT